MNLKDLADSENFIEIRNKVDIFLDENPGVKLDDLKNDDRILHVSATKKVNLDLLKELLLKKIYQIYNCKIHIFKHKLEEHQ